MKTISKGMLFLLVALSSISLFCQKKAHTFSVERVISVSAEKVWSVVGEGFGGVAKSHPKIISSKYINGPHKAGEGAERVCYVDKRQTRYTHERMVDYSPSNYTFRVNFLKAELMSLDPKYTYVIYSVKPKNANSCVLTIKTSYRTKLGFLSKTAKCGLTKRALDYVLAIEHHSLTGEAVNKNNFKEIKKKYKS